MREDQNHLEKPGHARPLDKKSVDLNGGNSVYDWVIMSAFFAALIFSLLVFLPPASAEDENPTHQWFKDHVKGSFRYKNFAHFYTTEAEQRTVRQEGILRLEVDQTFQENWRFFLVPEWKADTAN